TVFSIVIAYEYKIKYGDDGVLKAIRGFSRAASVDAYLNAVKDDPKAHDDGRAADAAFSAYFSRRNAAILKTYDVSLCDRFMNKARNDMKVFDKPVIGAYYHECAPHMRSMPYLENGVLKERPAYM